MAKFPGDLESSYSEVFKKLVASINKEYTVLLRQVLKEEEIDLKKSRGEIKLNSTLYRRVVDKLKKLREKLFNKSLFKQTLESMNNVMDRVAGRIERDIVKQFKKRKFPIPEVSLKAESAELKKAIERNVDLITRITTEQASVLSDTVEKAIKGGSNTDEIIKQVQEISDNGLNYAEFVARDQVAKAHGAINKDMQTRAGFPGYIWRATGDGRTRPDHNEQDGKFFYWDAPPLLKNGNFHPGEDYQCRCIAEPAFEPE